MSCSKKAKDSALLELIAGGREKLLQAGIEEAREECERILMKLLSCARSELYLKEHELDVSGVRADFLMFLEKRTHRVPLAYLLKEADFWQETLFIDERCLIPRAETEVLVERVLKTFDEGSEKSFSFLDVGTGSGAIAIALLRACQNARGTLLDVSGEALEVARENVSRHALEARARLICGNMFGPFGKDEKWDLIVSNPPYLSEEDWKGVQEELKHEPREALDGGKDGLDFYRRVVQETPGRLNRGGRLALEVGKGQAERVSTWLHEAGYVNIQRFQDYSGVERVIIAKNK